MSFDSLSQIEIEMYANFHRMDKKLSKNDRDILHNIIHSRHPDRIVYGVLIKNPYAGIWTDEIRDDIIKQLERIRDKYNLRVYENEQNIKTKNIIRDLMLENDRLKKKNNYNFVEKYAKNMEKITGLSGKTPEKAQEIYKIIKDELQGLADIDTELDHLRRLYDVLRKKKWIKCLEFSDKVIEEELPDRDDLYKERQLTYNFHNELVLTRIIGKEVERKGWIPDISTIYNKNDRLVYINDYLKKNLPFNKINN